LAVERDGVGAWRIHGSCPRQNARIAHRVWHARLDHTTRELNYERYLVLLIRDL
jgi:hypothetical protein